jgi:RNA polymerase sigma-70 factor (ECF subfamily)
MSRLRDPQRAADIAQDVYIRLIRIRGRTRIRDEKAFLFMVATNLVRDEARRVRANVVTGQIDSNVINLPGVEPSPERVVESRQALKVLFESIGQLKPQYRQALVLHRFGGMSYPQIAVEMGLSVSTVEKYIIRALRYFREQLEKSVGVEEP